MENYNNNIKRNIRQLMKDHKPEVKQRVLENITGMTQSNVSKCLSEKHKNRFTLDQLIVIADYFRVTLDSILGRNLDNARQKDSSTMQDIVSALFELERVGFDITVTEYADEEYDEFVGFIPININTYHISFPQESYLNGFIGEWDYARQIMLKNKSKVSKDMYELWKKEKLSEAADIPLDEMPFD